MPTPAEEDAFLEPILARYADDGPRLVFADFLEESAAPADAARGELVRLQCALARLPADDPRRRDLVSRETELVQEYQAVWGAALTGLAVGWEFRRGLLDTVSVDAPTFLARGDELFRRAPIRRVRILDAARHIGRLANCPFLAAARELDLCGNDLGNGGVNLLLRSPYLSAVAALDLSFNGVCDGGVRLLARSAALPRLRELALNDNGHVSGDGVAQLAGSPHLAGLRVLDVSGNDVGDAGVRAVVKSLTLTRLHTFRVFANHIGDAGVAALVGSELFVRLMTRDAALDLRQNAIGAAGTAALGEAAAAAAVEVIDLSGNYLGDEGLMALARSGGFPRLRKLSVRQNQIGDRGAFALARSPIMRQLVSLDVSANQLTPKGIDALWSARADWRTAVEVSDNLASPELAREPDGPSPPHRLDQAVGEVLRRLVPAPR
jgi:uncharacterized protein (TIGR02996 family)